MKHMNASLALFLGLTMILPAFALAQSFEPGGATLLAFGARPDNSPNNGWGRDSRSDQRDRDEAWRNNQRDREDAWRNKHRDKDAAWHRENRYENSDERRQDEQNHQRDEAQRSRDDLRSRDDQRRSDAPRDGQHRP